jgi:hypothetical protein
MDIVVVPEKEQGQRQGKDQERGGNASLIPARETRPHLGEYAGLSQQEGRDAAAGEECDAGTIPSIRMNSTRTAKTAARKRSEKRKDLRSFIW